MMMMHVQLCLVSSFNFNFHSSEDHDFQLFTKIEQKRKKKKGEYLGTFVEEIDLMIKEVFNPYQDLGAPP
jgi:hypothetical protein